MAGMDGTGPFGDQNWQCRRTGGRNVAVNGAFGRGNCRGFGGGFKGRSFGGGFGPGCARRPENQVTLSKEEQKKILEAELKEIEAEGQEIAKAIKELE